VYDSTAYASAVAIYWIIDLFILFVAGMFVTNMLGRAVAERRIEFGTLRAIGVPSRTILASVVAEALFVVVCSFALGFLVSLALGWAVNAFYAPVVHFDHLFAVDPGTDALLFGITLALGAVAGFFPARAATKVDPLDVLREA
jgi:putative ABC transport system permease protein